MGPGTVNQYLSALNASLELGIRSRRRILIEIAEHLCETATIEAREGVSPAEAQARAIAALGSPQDVAAGFESDFAGALDKRLALIARGLDAWMARHPWGGAALRTAFILPAVAATVALGAAFDAGRAAALHAAHILVVGAVLSSLYLGFKAWRVRERPEAGLRARLWAQDPRVLGVYEDMPMGGAAILAGTIGCVGSYADSVGAPFLSFLGPVLLGVVLAMLLKRLVYGAHARIHDHEKSRSENYNEWEAFRLDHPWWTTFLHPTCSLHGGGDRPAHHARSPRIPSRPRRGDHRLHGWPRRRAMPGMESRRPALTSTRARRVTMTPRPRERFPRARTGAAAPAAKRARVT